MIMVSWVMERNKAATVRLELPIRLLLWTQEQIILYLSKLTVLYGVLARTTAASWETVVKQRDYHRSKSATDS